MTNNETPTATVMCEATDHIGGVPHLQLDTCVHPHYTGNHVTVPYWAHDNCGGKGTNRACQKAAKLGRTWHVAPRPASLLPGNQHLVMPTHHYFTEAEGAAAIEAALEHAETVRTDEDLYRLRDANMPYKLNPGWIDPTRRR